MKFDLEYLTIRDEWASCFSMMQKNYKDTLSLPETLFAMRANLPEREPETLAFWQEIKLWQTIRQQSKGRAPYILHDGPPYANGNIHIGTALNKILKDIINRSRQMAGFDAHYIPGWDCHGLPIEWKIEEQYRAKGLNKNDVPILEFRKQCRDFASHWLNVQREEFKRLGVMGDWDHPYSTMNFESEAIIAGEICKFLMSGSLYRGSRPVMWSVVEQTALAEAELEYYEHKSPTITVAFEIIKGKSELLGANVLIWTTTPWTIPANRAIACNLEMDYALIEILAVDEGSYVRVGGKYLLAKSRLEVVLGEAKVTDHKLISLFKGAELEGIIAAHPFRGQGFEQDTPLLSADFVTEDQGTGFVHIAPGHGADDWHLGRKHGIEIPITVLPSGQYRDDLPLFGGAVVIDQNGKEGNANGLVIKNLLASGRLFSKASLRHQYPHSWRSKAPLIFLNTPQWFISLETNKLREIALKGIADTDFFPPQGRNRLHGMIANRPDWCVSRQRAWGVPIPIFVHKKTGEPLKDDAVNQAIIAAFKENGGDAWYSLPASHFLGKAYQSDDYEQVMDVVDVWFDSGSTHAFCLEPRANGNGANDLAWPADLYLEGTDQHRGWFHSSLLEACGTRGRPPFKAVLTHGFVLAEDGRKMSKSLGNQVYPQEVNDKFGAEILRMWVVSEDYLGDLRIGPNNLKQMSESYRRFRNSLKWLLGNLNNCPADLEKIAFADMPMLEQWVLNRLKNLEIEFNAAAKNYNFGTIFRGLLQFCTVDLSAIYFDVRKDTLYCDSDHSLRRRASFTALEIIFDSICKWLAPILVFTTEEAYQLRRQQKIKAGADSSSLALSIHMEPSPSISDEFLNFKDMAQFKLFMEARKVIFGALEEKRAEKVIGSSLEAAPILYFDLDARPELAALLGVKSQESETILKELTIISALKLTSEPAPDGAWALAEVSGMKVVFQPAQGDKCPRCWTIHQDPTAKDPEFPDDPPLCSRCHDTV